MPKARAVRILAPGGPEVLTIGELEVADPGPNDVLIEVAAAGLNRADLLQRQGRYPAPHGFPADVPGLEYAGRVAAIGRHVGAVAVGDEVIGIVGGGAMATHVLVHEREVMRAPAGVSLVDAAAIPEAFLTAYDALFEIAELAAGEHALIHAAASGVGTAAIQVTRAAGAVAIGTSRTADKLARCEVLGLHHAIRVADGRFASAVRAIHPAGAEVVIDFVGASYAQENAEALALRGRWVVVGLLGGTDAPMPLARILGKRLRLSGTVLRSRPLEEKAALTQRFARTMLPRFATGDLAPVVDAVMPMHEIAEAHARMERNDTFGKIVLTW